MGKYLHLFDTVSAYTEARENDYLEPWVSLTKSNNEVNYNKSEREKLKNVPLTFEILSTGAINWAFEGENQSHAKTIEYKKNDGEWTSITSTQGGTQINVVSGDTVQFRGDNLYYAALDGLNLSWANMFYGTTCQFNVKGNIMSLIDSDGFETLDTLTCAETFAALFMMYTGLTSAENLILPATTLTESCYNYMFYGCTSLTTSPELPATTLADYCYMNMFYQCQNLTTAPELPATTLADGCYMYMFIMCTSLTTAPELPAMTLAAGCYYGMFGGCTSLTTAPALPATALTSTCYNGMFEGCTSLTTAPELPATTLADSCYSSMFASCTSLTTAPELPATTLVSSCYYGMFDGCTNLNYIKAMFTTTPGGQYTSIWVDGVSSTGTFVKNSAAQWDVTGHDGIPAGWTVETA